MSRLRGIVGAVMAAAFILTATGVLAWDKPMLWIAGISNLIVFGGELAKESK